MLSAILDRRVQWSSYWIDLASWFLACREFSAEIERLDREIVDGEAASLAEITQARQEHERSRAEIYIPD